jgi:undecaprenyl-diphosphatase
LIERVLDLDRHYTGRLRVAEKPGVLRTLAAALAHSGDSWFWAFVLVPAALLAPPPYARQALIWLAAVFVTAVLVLAIKFSVRRRRPEGEWGQIYRKTDPHSFPSGHAARAVLLAVLALGMGPPGLGIALAVWAPLVVLARVAMGVHYLLDVVAGALLGALIGLVILAFI